MNHDIDTLPARPAPGRDILRLEEYTPLMLGVHATLIFVYGLELSPDLLRLWLGGCALIGTVLWVLSRRDTKRRFMAFRAFYLAGLVWVVTLMTGGTTSFFYMWHFTIMTIYVPLLAGRYAAVLIVFVAVGYIMVYPFSPPIVPFIVVVLRALVLLVTGWFAFQVTLRQLQKNQQHQALRQQLIEAEMARQQLEKERELLRHKERFITVVSHEFRTPLAIIETSAYLLEKHYPRLPEERRVSHIREIRRQGAHMARLLNSIVTAEQLMAHREPTETAAIDVRQLCEEMIAEMRTADAEAHPLHVTFEGALEALALNAQHLRVILYHLLSNALKYSPAGSAVQIMLRREPAAFFVQVSDQGLGIPEREQVRVFQPFFRAENVTYIGGIGLGLALVYASVQQQGGSIDWQSAVGQGTVFTVRLPLSGGKVESGVSR
ncbi:MAG: HAMP domain-containing histidine kinase [Chloroflexi bacterium]|nr:HAMP domain-containing histidine kinase [Chloroflexota bacterium]